MNRQSDYLENLLELNEDLQAAKNWLLRSYGLCQPIGVRQDYEPQHYDAFENLASRFARASDLLFQKIFRGIDVLELVEGGSLLDAIHRAQKRGLIDSVEQIRVIREIRNQVVHEYQSKNLPLFFQELLDQTPVLLDLIDKASAYVQKTNKF
ncbi:MAG: hypothetical protein WCK49_10995 [Myxococcaceae bacterium]